MADKRIRRLIEVIFDRNSANRVEREMAASLGRAGRKGGDDFLRELKGTFNRQIAGLREDLARGIIDQAEFRKRSQEAAKAFNEGLLANIERVRKEGNLADQEYVRLARNLKRVGDEGGEAIGLLRRSMTSLRGVVLSVTGALAGLFAINRIRSFISESTNLAARYETLGVTLHQVGQNAGYTVGQLDAAAEALQRTGISMMESRSSAARLISAQIDLAHATDLARIAQDAAVIGNINSSEAFGRMIDGIASGNIQILRNIGLNVNFQRSYERLARQLGKNVGELTEVERAQARTNEVLAAGAGITGTYEASLETAGKQMGSNARLLEDLRIKLGQVFLPTFRDAVFQYADALKEAHRWIDNIERSQIEQWGRNVANVFNILTESVRILLVRARALTHALLVGGAVTALIRLRRVIIEADIATKGLLVTMRGAWAMLGPKGWFVLGVAALTEALYRFRDASKDATAEQEAYVASLHALTLAELDREIAALAKQKRDLERLRDSATSERIREGWQRQIDKVVAAGMEAIRARNALVQAAASGGSPDGDPADAFEDAEDGIRGIVRALKEGHELGILTREERERAFWLAVATREELDRTNASTIEGLQRRIELTRRLAELEGVTGERAVVPSVVSQEGLQIPALDLQLKEATARARPYLTEWETMLSQLGQHSSTVAMYMERSFENFFASLATGFDTTRDGFHSLAGAATGIGASIVAGLAGGMRDYHMAQSAGKLAEGMWPPNPAALASAAKHIVAAGMFGAVEGWAGSAGRRRGVPVPATTPTDVGRSAVDQAKRGAEVHIYIDPLDPQNPAYQRNVYAAHKTARDRFGEDAEVFIHPRGGG